MYGNMAIKEAQILNEIAEERREWKTELGWHMNDGNKT